MPDDETPGDNQIPIVCACGRRYIWHIHREDLPPCCPRCRAPIDDTDDDT
ncbi:MAG: hypothetical protein IT177_00870 [Acidobacteria bacterium]|nr:hypothetical protein [Acidobacteriota bacterium]